MSSSMLSSLDSPTLPVSVCGSQWRLQSDWNEWIFKVYISKTLFSLPNNEEAVDLTKNGAICNPR